MRFIKFSFFCVTSLALGLPTFSLVYAEEKAEPAKKEVASPEEKKAREYAEKTSKMTALGNRIEESEKSFKELVSKKNNAKTPEEKQEIIREMLELTKQRNKEISDFNRLKAEINYRFPNQGEKLERKYQTQGKRTEEEMENVAGLDELLSRTKKIIEKKFAPFMEDPKNPRSAIRESHIQGEEKSKTLRLSK